MQQNLLKIMNNSINNVKSSQTGIMRAFINNESEKWFLSSLHTLHAVNK